MSAKLIKKSLLVVVTIISSHHGVFLEHIDLYIGKTVHAAMIANLRLRIQLVYLQLNNRVGERMRRAVLLKSGRLQTLHGLVHV